MSITKIVVSRKVIRNCIWCAKPMDTLRCSKKTCTESCYNQLSYHNRKYYKHLSSTEFTAFIESLIASGDHINPSHPLYNPQQEEGEKQCPAAA